MKYIVNRWFSNGVLLDSLTVPTEQDEEQVIASHKAQDKIFEYLKQQHIGVTMTTHEEEDEQEKAAANKIALANFERNIKPLNYKPKTLYILRMTNEGHSLTWLAADVGKSPTYVNNMLNDAREKSNKKYCIDHPFMYFTEDFITFLNRQKN